MSCTVACICISLRFMGRACLVLFGVSADSPYLLQTDLVSAPLLFPFNAKKKCMSSYCRSKFQGERTTLVKVGHETQLVLYQSG